MKALVLFSGGVDSTTALASAIDKYGADQVIALSVSYGQKHDRELDSARRIAAYYGVEPRYLDLAGIFEGSDCSLLSSSDKKIPKESYKEQLDKTNGKPVSTYVPFRNGLFISCAASVALSNGCTEIWYGAHSDDAAGNAYPDCSSEFNDAILKVPYELTWSCYEGGDKPCGCCGTCLDRINAFRANGVEDPLLSAEDRLQKEL